MSALVKRLGGAVLSTCIQEQNDWLPFLMVGGKKVQSSNTSNTPVEEIDAQEKHVITANVPQDTGYVSSVLSKKSIHIFTHIVRRNDTYINFL